MLGAPIVVASSQTVAVGVTVVATVVVVGLAAAVAWMLHEAAALRRAAADLRGVAADLRAEAADLRAGLQAVASHAERELRRVEDLVGSAESISEVVGSASRLASTAMATPVIKAVALGSGAARAGRRLRRPRGGR
ncbi:MAG: hypothetical protein ACYCUG_12345 [Acidimicrobiales bacterium]